MIELEPKDSFLFPNEQSVRLYKFQPRNETIPRMVETYTVDELGASQDCILLGEPGSGLGKVFKRFIHQLGEPYIQIKQNLLESTIGNCDDEERRGRANKYIKRLSNCKNAHQCLITFLEWITDAKMCHLVLLKPEPILSKYFAQAFRTLRDVERTSFKLTIFTTSDDMFVDQAVQSGYFSLCTVFRMPRLSANHIQEWGKGENLKLDSNSIAKTLSLTGGQPVLFDCLYKVLRSIEADPQKWNMDTYDLAGDLMLRDLPHPIELWIEDLRTKIKHDPAIRDRLHNYLGSSLQSHRGVPATDRGLFISGWLGYHQNGDWGIVSEVHKFLIRKILLAR